MPHPLTLSEQQDWIDEREEYRQSLPPSPVPDFLTGLKGPRPPDSRDWLLANDPAVARQLEVGYPESYDLTKYVKSIYNQGAVPSCVATTMAAMQSVHQIQEEGVWRTFDAPLAHRETGPEQQGRWPDDLLRYCVNKGMPLVGSGQRYKITGYAFVNYDANWDNVIKAAIAAEKLITIAYLVPTEFGWNSGSTPSQGYHESLLISYEPGWYGIANSWGQSWGKAGFGRLRADYLKANNWQSRYVLVHAPVDERLGPTPPPPIPLSVTSYDPSSVRAGQNTKIFGSGFRPGARAIWEPAGRQVELTVGIPTPTEVSAIVPAGTAPGSGAVRVTVGQATATGPFLTVTSDDQPPPPDQLKVTGYVGTESIQSVKPGKVFQIRGQFPPVGVLQVNHGGHPLMVESRGAEVLTVQAAGVPVAPTPVRVRVEGSEATGPALATGNGSSPTPDPGPDPTPPPPPPVDELRLSLAYRRSINSLLIVCHVRDQRGQKVPATCSGQAGTESLASVPTNVHGWCWWQIRRTGGSIFVSAAADDGRKGEVRGQLPGEVEEMQPGSDPAEWQ